MHLVRDRSSAREDLRLRKASCHYFRRPTVLVLQYCTFRQSESRREAFSSHFCATIRVRIIWILYLHIHTLISPTGIHAIVKSTGPKRFVVHGVCPRCPLLVAGCHTVFRSEAKAIYDLRFEYKPGSVLPNSQSLIVFYFVCCRSCRFFVLVILLCQCQRCSGGTDHHVWIRLICSGYGRLHLPCGEFREQTNSEFSHR